MVKNFRISKKYQSLAFNERPKDAKIEFIILHSTERDFFTSLNLLCKDVSAHYLISQEEIAGEMIFNLVDDEKRAWHAGVSAWKNHQNLNHNSIGIEIENLDGNQLEYPPQQIAAVTYLCKYLMKKYTIPPENILAHGDIAFERKTDPGKKFPWQELAKNGIGINKNHPLIKKISDEKNPQKLQQYLQDFGYNINSSLQLESALKAFHSRF